MQARKRLPGVEIDHEAVRQARIGAGLSLAEVAGSALTRQAVHLIETGKARPSVRSLRIIADRLGMPISAFLRSSPTRPRGRDARVAELEQLCLTHQYERAIELADEVLRDETAPIDAQAGAHLYMGQALRHLGHTNAALEHLQRARELFEALDDPWMVAETMDWQASTLHPEESLEAVSLAEQALRQYRSLEPRQPATEARMLEHLGNFLIGQQAFEQARNCYEEALHLAGGLLDLARLAHIYQGLSHCHANLGDLSRAIELAERAVVLYAIEDDLRPRPAHAARPRAENDLAQLLLRQGQLERAESLLTAALARLATAGADRLRPHLLLSLAELRYQQGRMDEAQALSRQVVELADRVSQPEVAATAYERLGQIHAQRGEQAKASRCLRRARELGGRMGTPRRGERSAVPEPQTPESTGHLKGPQT
jgi:tetratricopeptide (TPR) repeat protein